MHIFSILFIFLSLQKSSTLSIEDIRNQEGPEYWHQINLDQLFKSRKLTPNENVAKNIIIFIGDGMGIPTITAARWLKQKEKSVKNLIFDQFPYSALTKTYCVDNQTPDSACTASAIYSGIKTNYGTLGYDSSAIRKNISSVQPSNQVETILTWAQKSGKATGFVTTARVTHATPAALYAHVVERDYECDSVIPAEDTISVDIASQLVYHSPGQDINVVLGGGLQAFLPSKSENKSYISVESWNCPRNDDKNLVQDWLKSKPSKAEFVHDLNGLEGVSEDTEYLLGLFDQDHIPYIDARKANHPDLPRMTSKALEVLRKQPNGFFLMVEGARIDMGHHENWAARALKETLEFDVTIEATLESIDLEDTLVIVTADHSHTLSMTGYSYRNSDILGFSRDGADDDKPTTILSYANGPSFEKYYQVENGRAVRFNMSELDPETLNKPDFAYPSAAPKGDESHGGEDIATFAIGPMAHLFQATHEQTYIAYVMAYAACIGPFEHTCHGNHEDHQDNLVFVRGIQTKSSIWFIMLLVILLIVFYCTTTGKSNKQNDYNQV